MALQHSERALKQAGAFGEMDARYATTLNMLAVIYDDQRRYAEAELLYRRALAIEK